MWTGRHSGGVPDVPALVHSHPGGRIRIADTHYRVDREGMMTKILPSRRWCRRAVVAAVALAGLSAAGCGSGSSSAGADVSSQASSVVSSLASQAGSAVGSAASQASSSVSSAVSSALGGVSGAVTAASDVTAGPVTIGSDGRAVSQLTVHNPTSEVHDYTISVAFDDPSGNLLDATAVTVSKVPPNGSATATARSNRDLSGTLTAKISAAIRH